MSSTDEGEIALDVMGTEEHATEGSKEVPYNTSLEKLTGKSLKELQELEVLEITEKSLRAIPAELGQLQNLKVLRLDYNVFDSVPLEVSKLKNLEELYLVDNEIYELPSWLVKLKKLRVLDVSDNNLTELPSFISHFPSLEKFSIGDNIIMKASPKILLNQLRIPLINAGTPGPKDLNTPKRRLSFLLESVRLRTHHGNYSPEDTESYVNEIVLAARAVNMFTLLIEKARDMNIPEFFGHFSVKEFVMRTWHGAGYRVCYDTRNIWGMLHTLIIPFQTMINPQGGSRVVPSAIFYCHFILFLIMGCLFTVLCANFFPTTETYFFNSVAIGGPLVDSPLPQTETNSFEKTFMGIDSFDSFWLWVAGPLSETTLNGDCMIDNYNFITGSVVFRQLRTHAVPCEYDGCYTPFSLSTETHEPYGPQHKWTFTERKSKTSHFSPVGYSYPEEGGFIVQLDCLANDSLDILQEMKEFDWIDVQTRAVFIEFTIYNNNLDLFSTAQILIEVSLGGAVVPSFSFFPFQLEPLSVDAALVLFLMLYLFFVAEELHEIGVACKSGKKAILYHFNDIWNCCEFCFYSLILVAIVTHVNTVFITRDLNYDPQLNTEFDCVDCTTFISLAYAKQYEVKILSVTFLFGWAIFLKYVRFGHGIGVLIISLFKMLREIVKFGVLYLIFTVGFAGAFTMVVGSNIYVFRNWVASIIMFFRISLGDFTWEEIDALSNRYAIAIMVLYVLLAFIILLNLIIAMLNESYSRVMGSAGAEFMLEKAKLTENYKEIPFLSHFNFGWLQTYQYGGQLQDQELQKIVHQLDAAYQDVNRGGNEAIKKILKKIHKEQKQLKKLLDATQKHD